MPRLSFVKILLARLGIIDPFRRPSFNYIEFETTAYCNRACAYCPVSKHQRAGDQDGIYMRESTFDRLLHELQSIRFQGKLAPHMYGEPMSDPRLTAWISKARSALPQAAIRLVTNGDYLNRDTYDALLRAGVTYFDVSLHSPAPASGLRDLIASLPREVADKTLRLRNYYEDYHSAQNMLNTRGGEIELNVEKRHPTWCNYVLFPVLNTFGDVVLCCNDFHGRYKFGNINERSLMDIWNDPENLRVRRRVFRSHFDLPICQSCYR